MAPQASEAFSLLMPVYAGDTAPAVEAALVAATDGQVVAPAQVVIAQDGPVGDELRDRLDRWVARRDVVLVRLAQNQGIAAALNAGLRACVHPVVARADADDVSLPGRFAAQLPLVTAGLDVVGGAMVEFTEADGPAAQAGPDGVLAWARALEANPEAVPHGTVRRYPEAHSDIAQTARLTNPMAHPTVMFRRAVVMRAGGYQKLTYLEDYLLWARCLMQGARFANLPEILVAYRVSPAAYRRRGGPKVALAEAALQRTFRSMGFTSRCQEMRNLALRGGFELAPGPLRGPLLRRVWKVTNSHNPPPG
ncbi:MAG: glycosyltransferase [Bifidobacteriaceae bacterium]|jgi:glycosyltransferase involved in cell wall biosynthesis|nr:glycosyltransferase [Bifidobacteriaceae bacterium]